MKRLKLLVFTLILSLLWGLLPLVTNGVAASGPTYQFVLGESPIEGPVISREFGGDTVEITGNGTFSLGPNTVTGGGNMVHKDKDGNVINTGTWTATRLWNFVPYGTSEGFPANFEGGRALIGVHLTSSDGTIQTDGLLWVTCLIGNFPKTASEGIELLVSQFGLYFYSEVHGETLFIRMP